VSVDGNPISPSGPNVTITITEILFKNTLTRAHITSLANLPGSQVSQGCFEECHEHSLPEEQNAIILLSELR
jgi:hypothetical protein